MSESPSEFEGSPLAREQLLAKAAQGADRLVLAGLSRLFLGQPTPGGADEFARVLARLHRYDALLATPEQAMPRPARVPELRVVERDTPRSLRWPRGRALEEHAVFDTPYRPLDPEYAREYAGYRELDRVHVWRWLHARPPRGTLLLTHGWGVGTWWMHRLEYDVPYLFHRLGLDVWFYVAPFHGVRTPASARFGGQLHPSPNLVRTNEAFIQTAIEVQALISAILARHDAPLGMMGSSLGGYTSALLASLDDRLDFVIPVMAPASMAHLLWDHGGQIQLRARAEQLGLTRERFHALWALHSPLSHPPKVPWSRRMIVTALGDSLVTAEHTRPLWQHWDRPRHFRFPGAHAWQLGSGLYHREIGRFLHDIGVGG